MGIFGYIARERERVVHMRTINDDERRKTRPPNQNKKGFIEFSIK